MTNARFCIIPARSLGDERLQRADLLVLNALGLFGDRDGWCFPSHNTIANLAKIHRDSVKRAIGRLTECGYIEVRTRRRDDGGQASNEYRMLFDAPTEQLELAIARASNDDTPGAPMHPPRCADAPGPGAHTPPPRGVASPPHITPHLTPHLTPQENPPLSPAVDKPGVFKNGKLGFKVLNLLTEKALIAARQAAPGWDIYTLMEVYDRGVNEGRRSPPNDACLAFPGFCKKYTKGKAA